MSSPKLTLALENDMETFTKHRTSDTYAGRIRLEFDNLGLVSFGTFHKLGLNEKELLNAVKECQDSSLDTELGEVGLEQFFRVIREVRNRSAILPTSINNSGGNSGKRIKLAQVDLCPTPIAKSPAFLNVLAMVDSQEGERARQNATLTPIPNWWVEWCRSNGEKPTPPAPWTDIPATPINPTVQSTQYIPRAQYLATQPQSSQPRPTMGISSQGSTQGTQESVGRGPKPLVKTEYALIPLSDPRINTVRTALHFTEGSSTLLACRGAGYSDELIHDFLSRCFAHRRTKPQTLLKYTRFAVGFIDFATSKKPPAPTWGDASLLVIIDWLDALRSRGETVPRNGLYALRWFGEALGIEFPLEHPSICQAERISKLGKIRQSPLIPLEFVFKQ